MQTTGGSVSPRLGVDSAGSIYLVWKEMRNSQSGHIFFNRSIDGEELAAGSSLARSGTT
jgi:hypothetical protein